MTRKERIVVQKRCDDIRIETEELIGELLDRIDELEDEKSDLIDELQEAREKEAE